VTRLVVEEGLLRRLGHAGAAVDVVRRTRARGRRGRWLPLDCEETLAVVLGAGPGALVLARPPAADPGAACLARLAAAAGVPVLRLPEHPDAAAWTVGVAARWAEQGPASRLARLIAVLVAATARGAARAGLPLRPWGAEGVLVPALRPATLARWAAGAWRACAWCREGGGLAGAACACCGLALSGGRR
jgi:hypothetical protein